MNTTVKTVSIANLENVESINLECVTGGSWAQDLGAFAHQAYNWYVVQCEQTPLSGAMMGG